MTCAMAGMLFPLHEDISQRGDRTAAAAAAAAIIIEKIPNRVATPKQTSLPASS